MSASINLSASIRTNLISLQSTSALLETTQNRLSTGLKVSSAIDDPSAFFAARALTNRASDLVVRKDGIGQAISALQNADKGLTTMTALVDQAKSILSQAQEAASQTSSMISSDVSTGVADMGANFAGLADGDTFTIKVGDAAAVTITIADGDGAADVAASIDAADSGINAAYNATTGKITITAVNAGTDVIITEGTNTPAAAMGLTVGTTTFGSTGGADTAQLETDYKEILAQMDSAANDAGYKGVNLLKGDSLTVQFNEDGGSSLAVTGVTYNSTGLGFTASASVDFDTAGNIDDYLDEVDDALTTIRSQASTFGSNLSVVQIREDFTTNMINTLTEGAGKLVNADLNEEGANLLALQTRQALGTQALSFATQSEQSVLQLFR